MTEQPLFGVLNVYKPGGVTSRDVVNSVQRLIRPTKCGHAGTLDPMATGVLLIGIGPATRLTTMLQDGTKTYVAEFVLGQSSDTDDNTGKMQQHPAPDNLPNAEAINARLQSMTGIVSQVPPIFSAVHVDGQRAYDLARRGQAVELSAKNVEIHSIRLLSCEWPRLELEIICGSGTYIRSIARDLGNDLGCGGLMSRLERTKVGRFAAIDGIPANELTLETIRSALCPAVSIVQHMPQYDCTTDDVANLLCGRILSISDVQMRANHILAADEQVALTANNFADLIAIAVVTSDLRLQPRTVFVHK
ncbi:MAG: tRNA pseudouridine(55) synthase TruB [Planctomycetota bacterium]|nr:tRNA pseudouridine(55) synthase TruB [Planctomycetota bacterium]